MLPCAKAIAARKAKGLPPIPATMPKKKTPVKVTGLGLLLNVDEFAWNVWKTSVATETKPLSIKDIEKVLGL